MKESQNVEWKETWNDEYLKWICGFANAQGGTLFIGIRDDGSVCGVKNATKLMEDIPNKVRDVLGIMVDLNTELREGKEILEIVVHPTGYPVNYRGEYHYRSGTTKQLLKGAQLTEFLLRKTGYRWDAEALPRYRVEDLDRESFEIFQREAIRHGRMTSEDFNGNNLELLEKLQLITEDGALKRAAVMTFYRFPEKIATGAYTKIGYFENDADILYQDEVHGSLLYQADRVIDLLYTKYLKAKITYDNLTRVETYPYPKLALREAIFNALVHNNYARGVPIQISVYANKLYIGNDVSALEQWTSEKLLGKHRSVQTNPSIANVFFRCGFIEAWGRGIEKICRECDRTGNKYPTFDISDCGFMVCFDALESALIKDNVPPCPSMSLKCPSNVPQDVPQDVPQGGTQDGTQGGTQELTEIQHKILTLIEANPKISRAEIAKQCGVTTKTIGRYLATIKNIVQFMGSGYSGHWEIRKPFSPHNES